MTGNYARARMGGAGLSTLMNESGTVGHREHFSIPCKFSTNAWVQVSRSWFEILTLF